MGIDVWCVDRRENEKRGVHTYVNIDHEKIYVLIYVVSGFLSRFSFMLHTNQKSQQDSPQTTSISSVNERESSLTTEQLKECVHVNKNRLR